MACNQNVSGQSYTQTIFPAESAHISTMDSASLCTLNRVKNVHLIQKQYIIIHGNKCKQKEDWKSWSIYPWVAFTVEDMFVHEGKSVEPADLLRCLSLFHPLSKSQVFQRLTHSQIFNLVSRLACLCQWSVCTVAHWSSLVYCSLLTDIFWQHRMFAESWEFDWEKFLFFLHLRVVVSVHCSFSVVC